jgi:phage terminase Nu1 subunit (DNA packaging protein)
MPVTRAPNLISQTELAKFLGTSRTQVALYTRQGAPVHSSDGHTTLHDSGAFVRWLIERHRAATPTQNVTHAEGQRRLTAAKARRAELLLAEDEGELVRVDDVTQGFADRLVAFRAALYEIPDRSAKQLAITSDPAEIARLLYEQVNTVLALMVEDE